MSDKRGISAVVATVLIILITIASVTIVWSVIIPMINNNLQFSNIEGRVEIVTIDGYTAYDDTDETLSVQLKQTGSDEVIGAVIYVTFAGDTVSEVVDAPGLNKKKTYLFDLSANPSTAGKTPDTMKVAPVFNVNNVYKTVDPTSEIKTVTVATIVPLPALGEAFGDNNSVDNFTFSNNGSSGGGSGAVCGNGVIESGETCDDSGTSGGDGCDATCQEESGWTCTGEPSSCTLDPTCTLTASVIPGGYYLSYTGFNSGVPLDANSVRTCVNASVSISACAGVPDGQCNHYCADTSGIIGLEPLSNGVESATCTYDLDAVDTTPPVITGGVIEGISAESPTTANLPEGTTFVYMNVTTDEAATCKYAFSPGLSYSAMGGSFASTGATSHSEGLPGLTDGSTNKLYIKCGDALGNNNTVDHILQYSVADTLSYSIIKSNDDTNARFVDGSAGGNQRSSFLIQIGVTGGAGPNYTGFMIFNISGVPANSNILTSNIFVTAGSSNSSTTEADIYLLSPDGYWEGNGFGTSGVGSYGNATALNSIPTEAVSSVHWNIDPFTVDTSGYSTPDISSLIQYRVDDASYSSIDLVGLKFAYDPTNVGLRALYSYDVSNPPYLPILNVTYWPPVA